MVRRPKKRYNVIGISTSILKKNTILVKQRNNKSRSTSIKRKYGTKRYGYKRTMESNRRNRINTRRFKSSKSRLTNTLVIQNNAKGHEQLYKIMDK